MPLKIVGAVGTEPWPVPEHPIPHVVWSVLNSFLVDKRTGNVVLNIKEGRILGMRTEEVHSLK